jgi:hypothetical protein
MMRNLIFFLLSAFLINSCSDKDITPSWLVIESIDLSTDEVSEGVNSHNITDAWIYMDNSPIGVFELPARIPIIAEGEHDFIIYGGIKTNGISATRVRYPFYNRHDVTLNLVKNEEITVNPIVTYKSNLEFPLIEDFENIGFEFVKNPISDTNITVISNNDFPEIVKYGNNCGAIYLSESDSIYKGLTSLNMALPHNEDVFVEIDYMNDNSMAMGVIAENSGGTAEHTPLVVLNPQENSSMVWKKIYIDLKDDVSFEINATTFEIYLLSILDADKSNSSFYIDNIKVVHYQ